MLKLYLVNRHLSDLMRFPLGKQSLACLEHALSVSEDCAALNGNRDFVELLKGNTGGGHL
jgi:hypothetical protein